MKFKGTSKRKLEGAFKRQFEGILKGKLKELLKGNLKELLKGKLVGEADWKLSRGISNLGLGESGETSQRAPL